YPDCGWQQEVQGKSEERLLRAAGAIRFCCNPEQSEGALFITNTLVKKKRNAPATWKRVGFPHAQNPRIRDCKNPTGWPSCRSADSSLCAPGLYIRLLISPQACGICHHCGDCSR